MRSLIFVLSLPLVMLGQEPVSHSPEQRQEPDESLYVTPSISANPKLAIPVTLTMQKASLREILVRLSQLTGVEMVFDDRLVNVRGIDIAVTGRPLGAVLDDLLGARQIDYLVAANGRLVIGRQERVSETVGSIRGKVRDQEGEELPNVNVMLKGTRIGCTTGIDGTYLLAKLSPGLYTVEVRCVGWVAVVKEVLVRAGETLKLDITLEQTSFKIGAIECVAVVDLIPKDAHSKTLISGAEVEHYQASSVGDVLDLVPGVQKTANPGLSKTSQVAVRGDQSDQLSAFGTLVMIDGIPVSNNANLQFEKYAAAASGVSNMRGGADLRTIPADNVQSIEVISGVPSARYGDVTSGIINVQTKIGTQPHRLKIKNNPDTREANFGGGFMTGETGISYNANIGRSERDIRKDGDEFTRVTGQVVLNNAFFDNRLTMNNKFYYQRLFDEEQPKGDVWQTSNYNRGYTLTYANWGRYNPTDAISSFEYNTYVTYRKENSMRSRLVQSDIRVTPAGDTISTYLGKVETRGAEWTLGARLEWNRVFYTGDLLHRFILGSDLQYNANTGEGVMVDSVFNYYGSSSGRSSYSFDDIPGQTLLSFYAEDKFTGNIGFDFTASAGLRYELYRPFAFNLKGLWGDGDLVRSHQGSYVNPRFSLLFYLSPENQIRLSGGYSSKSPAMSAIYPAPDVIMWRNPAEQRVIYFSPDIRVPDLKGHREGQIEIGYDHKFFNFLGSSLTAFYKSRKNEPRGISAPIFQTATMAGNPTTYFVDTYSRYANVGWTQTKGLELTLRTSQIRPLNMEFQVVGSYSFVKSGSNTRSFDGSPDPSMGQFPNNPVPGDTLIGFWYPSSQRWEDRFILNYYIRYTVPPLGLWVTFRAEQLVFERYQNSDLQPVDYAMLSMPSKIQRDWEEAIQSKYVKWLFNLNISKSLFTGAEISFYVNNFLDDPAINRYMTSSTTWSDYIRNPDLFYGIEFSMSLDDLF